MIKKYLEFLNESSVPGPSETGSAKIDLSEEEIEWFSTEPALQKLIVDNKVSLLPPELWYTSNDRNTINSLENFFPNVKFETEDEEDYEEDKGVGLAEDEENESVVNEGNSDELVDFLKWLKKLKKEVCAEALGSGSGYIIGRAEIAEEIYKKAKKLGPLYNSATGKNFKK